MISVRKRALDFTALDSRGIASSDMVHNFINPWHMILDVHTFQERFITQVLYYYSMYYLK